MNKKNVLEILEGNATTGKKDDTVLEILAASFIDAVRDMHDIDLSELYGTDMTWVKTGVKEAVTEYVAVHAHATDDSLKAYFVDCGDGEHGYAVIAHNEQQAVQIALGNDEYDLFCDIAPSEVFDVEATLQTDANIEGLTLGMVLPDADALRRKLYTWVESDNCEDCNSDTRLSLHEGKALCDACINKSESDES